MDNSKFAGRAKARVEEGALEDVQRGYSDVPTLRKPEDRFRRVCRLQSCCRNRRQRRQKTCRRHDLEVACISGHSGSPTLSTNIKIDGIFCLLS